YPTTEQKKTRPEDRVARNASPGRTTRSSSSYELCRAQVVGFITLDKKKDEFAVPYRHSHLANSRQIHKLRIVIFIRITTAHIGVGLAIKSVTDNCNLLRKVAARFRILLLTQQDQGDSHENDKKTALPAGVSTCARRMRRRRWQ